MTDEDLRVQLARTDERATMALELIAKHEKSCDRRYNEIAGSLKSLRDRWVYVGGAVIFGLFGIVGYLLVNGRPWG